MFINQLHALLFIKAFDEFRPYIRRSSGSIAVLMRHERVEVLLELLELLSRSDNLIHDSAGVKRHAGQGWSTAHATATVFCPFQKQCRKTRRTAFSFKQRSEVEYQQFLTEINYKGTQNVTLTEVILLREKMFSCSKQSRYFWNMYNVASSLVFPPYRGEGVWVRQGPWELYQR
jgi:hypothetical protein